MPVPDKKDSKKPNIVLLLLESWNAEYLTAFQDGVPEVTPFFSSLASKGRRYQNFYAGGTRSIEAIQALLTGFPSLQGFPNLGQGFELLKVSQLGSLAKQAGYRTIFAQSSPRRSYSLDSAAQQLGFEEYYGKEDFKTYLDYGGQADPQFGWDHNTFMSMAERLEGEDRPFLLVLFTGTTHTPFRLPPHPLNSKDHLEDNKIGFMNTLHYSDWAMGEFFEKCKKESWFSNTFFIFTADHTLQAYDPSVAEKRFRVPLLLFHEKAIAPGDELNPASHVDIFPTLLRLMGIEVGMLLQEGLFGRKRLKSLLRTFLAVTNHLVLYPQIFTCVLRKAKPLI